MVLSDVIEGMPLSLQLNGPLPKIVCRSWRMKDDVNACKRWNRMNDEPGWHEQGSIMQHIQSDWLAHTGELNYDQNSRVGRLGSSVSTLMCHNRYAHTRRRHKRYPRDRSGGARLRKSSKAVSAPTLSSCRVDDPYVYRCCIDYTLSLHSRLPCDTNPYIIYLLRSLDWFWRVKKSSLPLCIILFIMQSWFSTPSNPDISEGWSHTPQLWVKTQLSLLPNKASEKFRTYAYITGDSVLPSTAPLPFGDELSSLIFVALSSSVSSILLKDLGTYNIQNKLLSRVASLSGMREKFTEDVLWSVGTG